MKYYFALPFPAEEMVHCDLSISRIDAPNDMPVFDAIVYLRKESLSYPNHLKANLEWLVGTVINSAKAYSSIDTLFWCTFEWYYYL